jgi:prepilin-type processing-associated H-X9-DG protein
MNAYHDGLKNLPPRRGRRQAGGNDRINGFAYLLPYIEQGPLEAAGNANNWTTDAFNSMTVWDAQIPTLLCPSDAQRAGGRGNTNYRMSAGDTRANQDTSGSTAVRGPFGRESKIRLSDIKDGTSNTVMLSERIRQVDAGTNDRAAINYNFNPSSGDQFSPQQCQDAYNPNTATWTAYGDGADAGTIWGHSSPAMCMITTNGPPNSVSCLRGNHDTDNNAQTWVVPPSSFHPGGVNVAFCDGGVKFIRDSISAGSQSTTANRTSGVSDFGVWGAMGTKSAGDIVTFD